jgi:hypothetical protein
MLKLPASWLPGSGRHQASVPGFIRYPWKAMLVQL